MLENKRSLFYALASVLALGLMSGCATQSGTAGSPSQSVQSVAAEKTNYFLVFHENGRIYPIADAKNYLAFLDVDELIYTRTRVGAGPEGETIVFGIQKKEADDLNKPSLAEQFFDGKMTDVGPFYGEVVRDGRFYVFGEWKDFKDYLDHKEVTFTFTEIGTGPKGETVIYALNKKTKDEGRPVALIESFKQLHKTK
jgi:hypothetical protein